MAADQSNSTAIRNANTVWLIGLAVITILILVYGFVITRSIAADDENEYKLFSEVEVLPLDVSFHELDDHRAEWESVTLPFHWRNRFRDRRAVWYRFVIADDELELSSENSPNQEKPMLGIYIWRLNQTADVWFNGSKIGSGGSSSEPMARHWNSPIYFSVPSGLWNEHNVVLIQHFSQHNWGSIEPIILGSERYLRPAFERRYFIQHDIALGLFVFVFSTGIFSITVWFYRRQDVEYLWFSFASAGISFYCLNQFIRYLPFSADAWRWLLNVSIDVWACCTLMYILRSLQRKTALFERIVYAYLLSGVPLYFYASFYQVFDINIYYHVGSLLLGVFGIQSMVKEYLSTREYLPVFYGLVFLLLFVAGIHDLMMQAVLNNGWWDRAHMNFRFRHNLVHLAAPTAFLVLAAGLIKRFIDSMGEADELNKQLEVRVADAREELSENYLFMEELAIAKSTHEERERIYRDLHDDVGAKLLSLYYRLDKEVDSTLAKSALDDLRDIVSRKAVGELALSLAVEQWHEEVFERTEEAKLILDWDFDAGNTNTILSELQQTHLRRMLREGVSNVISHAPMATRVQINILVSADGSLTTSVSNDGADQLVEDWKSGRGISNLRVRSNDLNGEFSLKNINAGWVQVCWKIPLEAPQMDQS